MKLRKHHDLDTDRFLTSVESKLKGNDLIEGHGDDKRRQAIEVVD